MKRRKAVTAELPLFVPAARPRITALDFRSLRRTLQSVLTKVNGLTLLLIKNSKEDKA